ncbi:HD domain-containing protein [Limosilactobacillus fastidiosus]|uniref:HD domain-containing protein n=1 Tax=Limosilactobacillus fastidiosus TaxID=2759855 RepID=A0A7W3TZT3_9LACO|nr:HD domain-containing protein [Limosilactobacillus fastidiosus]MBB1063328.1 HD domain-containing protein [Limosilactobacillus fastidiosus]MBB1086302.1 HD domain-containing protein [Limosilactobacillus fastidiosus]MCD7084501.1 HD domain-containing protein [Limosilactobacillus fastidiosus]MCD7086406.1 HD domain-containing protein [Limosilactobacillus fastidiosus]MCD7114238.1 HD domain-containing protein [Limosilactobacillus fastidiosus]
MNQEQQLMAIKQFTIEKLAGDRTGHGMNHINRVVKNAARIANGEGHDPFLPEVAAYLHDTVDEKIVNSVEEAQAEVQSFLRQIGMTDDQIRIVMETIKNISFAHTLEKQQISLSSTAQIVRDADWLDAIGAIGITRAIYYGGAHGEVIYDPKIKPRKKMNKQEYRNLDDETIITHFDEKLLGLKDKLFTPTAKKIAEHRQQVMLDFLNEFHREWDAKS